MTEQEFQALLTLLNRAPLTPAEALWLNELLRKLRPQPTPDTKGV